MLDIYEKIITKDPVAALETLSENAAIYAVILAIERGTYVRIENMDSRTVPLVDGEYEFRTE